jgi:putative restriction endonuclease
MRERVPIAYFHAIERGQYAAAYPVFVVGDDPTRLTFSMQVDDLLAAIEPATRLGLAVADDDPEPRRAYVTATFRRRLHQQAFSAKVIRAYEQRCALCRLRHKELLDAAHITPDSDPEGEPLVSNGLSLCKLHHAAFDAYFFTVRPDYVIQVRESILEETDGPMLAVGLQQIHGQRILLPRRDTEKPDSRRLQLRLEAFLQS